jgi:hypothetical protein
MSITRRNALAAVAGCGLTAVAGAADDKPAIEAPKYDPVYGGVPEAVRKVFEDTFPHHRCIRLVVRGQDDKAVYRATLFDPADMWRASGRTVNGERIITPILDELELDARGKVLEEPLRLFAPTRLPKAVTAAFEKWNPKVVKGQEQIWQTEVARGKERVYRVRIILNAVKAYSASFQEDGTVVNADPAVVP